MELERLRQTIEEFRASGYREIRLATDEVVLELLRDDGSAQGGTGARETAGAAVQNAVHQEEAPGMQAAPAGETDGLIVRAQMAGTFYVAPKPDAEPFVSVGTAVKKGDTLGLLEAMKMISEITSPADGVVRRICLANEEFAEFDAPLFELEVR